MGTLQPRREGSAARPAPDFDSWVAARGPALMRLAFALTGDQVDAEDLVQEALSRALPTWGRISRLKDPDAYTKRMIVNTHTSAWRGTRRRESPVVELPYAGSTPGPDSKLPPDDRRGLWSALQALPVTQRTAVALRYSEQLDHAEIADFMGVGEGTARSQVSRAMSVLRQELGDDHADVSMLEARLGAALDLGTAHVATTMDLAAGARTRAGSRRRRRLVSAGVAVVLVAVLGISAVAADDRSPAPVPPVAEDTPTTIEEPDVPSGWRPVEWRGVRVHVPGRWGFGALTEWCERGPLLGTPVVDRPGGPREGIACNDPALGYGVQFLGPGRSRSMDTHAVRRPGPAEKVLFPHDAWIGVACGSCDVAVRVVAPDPYVARYLLNTYELVAAPPRT